MEAIVIGQAEIDRIIEVWEEFEEVLLKLADAITEVWGQLAEAINEAFDVMRSITARMGLYYRLRRWLPDWWAYWLAWHWPRRWMPDRWIYWLVWRR